MDPGSVVQTINLECLFWERYPQNKVLVDRLQFPQTIETGGDFGFSSIVILSLFFSSSGNTDSPAKLKMKGLHTYRSRKKEKSGSLVCSLERDDPHSDRAFVKLLIHEAKNSSHLTNLTNLVSSTSFFPSPSPGQDELGLAYPLVWPIFPFYTHKFYMTPVIQLVKDRIANRLDSWLQRI